VDDYTRKYGARSSSKPECYGEVDVYDSADPVCEDCPVHRACKVSVDKELRRVARDTSSGTRRRRREREEEAPDRVFRPKKNSEREDPEENDTFFSALIYNGTLSAMKAVLLEAHHGVDSIPHVRYPNPFLQFRRKRSSTKTEESE
jgi:hypothetical protein